MDLVTVIAIILFVLGLGMVVTTFKHLPLSNVWRQIQFIIGLMCIVFSVGLIKPRVDGWPVGVQQLLAACLVIGAILFAKLIISRLRQVV